MKIYEDDRLETYPNHDSGSSRRFAKYLVRSSWSSAMGTHTRTPRIPGQRSLPATSPMPQTYQKFSIFSATTTGSMTRCQPMDTRDLGSPGHLRMPLLQGALMSNASVSGCMPVYSLGVMQYMGCRDAPVRDQELSQHSMFYMDSIWIDVTRAGAR